MSAATSFETITLEIADKIAVITLNRPDKMNAFTGQMMLDMVAAFDLTDANDDVGAVIVTGAGRAFCDQRGWGWYWGDHAIAHGYSHCLDLSALWFCVCPPRYCARSLL
jgi:1,4-dihydroxy-2-naphthoyl-CoA synthase